MKPTKTCPKCGGTEIARVPDHPFRYASGNNIYTSSFTLLGKIPVIRYVCLRCGYVENWVESDRELREIRAAFGTLEQDRETARQFGAGGSPR